MKKGMSTEGAIITIVIFGVVMILLAIFYNSLFDLGKSEFTKRECQLSLQMAKAVDTVTNFKCLKWIQNPLPLRCERRFLEVTADDVLKDGDSIRYNYNPSCQAAASVTTAFDDERDESDLLEWGGKCLPENVFASEMEYCWSMFLEGTFPVFQQVEPSVFTMFDDEASSRACFVCAEILLNSGEDITDFTEYLKNKHRIRNTAGVDPSYFAYLARNRQSLCAQELKDASSDGTCWSGMGEEFDHFWRFWKHDWPALDQDYMKDGSTYAVTFIRHGMSSCRETDPEDEYVPTMTVQVLPAESIGDYCNMVMI